MAGVAVLTKFQSCLTQTPHIQLQFIHNTTTTTKQQAHLVNSTLRFLDCGGAAKLNQVRVNSTLTLDASPGMLDDGNALTSPDTGTE